MEKNIFFYSFRDEQEIVKVLFFNGWSFQFKVVQNLFLNIFINFAKSCNQAHVLVIRQHLKLEKGCLLQVMLLLHGTININKIL